MASITEELGYIIVAVKRKLMIIAAVLIAGFAISFPLLDRLILRIEEDLLPEGVEHLYVLSPLEAIMVKVKLSLVIGVLVVIPLICYYIYKTLKVRFGLTVSIKLSHIIILLGSAISLFILGLSYSYYFMLPLILKYLYADALKVGIINLWSLHEFILFVSIMTLILGVTFEVPLVIIFAVHYGLVQLSTLKEYRRYVYVAMFVIAAVVTPTTDVVSLLMVALPLIMCYEVGVLGARLLSIKRLPKNKTSSKHRILNG
jgi:sec-independent protein translocase protein TatC